MHDLVVLRLDFADRDAPALARPRSPASAASPAPHWRIGWMKWRMLREPSVSWLPYFSSSPGDCTTRTRAQSASSSSATIIGSVVRTPRCPSRRGGDDGDDSVRVDGDEDVRVVDDAMRHVVGAGGVRPWRCATGRKLGGEQRQPPPAPTPLRRSRRLTLAIATICWCDVGHVTPPSRRRERRRGCADSSRNGRCCPTSRRRSRSSVGFGFCCSSAAACMIWPAWQ